MLPIIFMHKGNAPFLQYTLAQARKWNPKSEIILLGDINNRKYADNVDKIKFYEYANYKKEAQSILAKNYKHYSTNPPEYEIICIARWYIILEFLKAEGKLIKSCFITDSDVLFYCDLEEERDKNFKNYRCTMTHNFSAGISFINDISILREYCDFVNDCYLGKNKFYMDKAISQYKILQANNKFGGISDMSFWGFLRCILPPFDFGESMTITKDLTTFDHNINSSYDYEMENEITGPRKKFVFRDGIPYCIHKRLGEIKFNCIHCQGNEGKLYIEELYRKGLE